MSYSFQDLPSELQAMCFSYMSANVISNIIPILEPNADNHVAIWQNLKAFGVEEEIYGHEQRHRVIKRYKGGKLYSEINPSYFGFCYNYCIRKWYDNGLLHRSDDLPAIIITEAESIRNCMDMLRYWDYKIGVSGPVIFDETMEIEGDETIYEWWLHGLRHRTTGPAIIGEADNERIVQYWVNGVQYQEPADITGPEWWLHTRTID